MDKCHAYNDQYNDNQEKDDYIDMEDDRHSAYWYLTVMAHKKVEENSKSYLTNRRDNNSCEDDLIHQWIC